MSKKKKQFQDHGKYNTAIIIFTVTTGILSLVYYFMMKELNLTSENFEINSPDFTHTLTAIAIGVLIGGSLAVVSMIYEGYDITGKTFIWSAGIIYPGITALICWLMTIMNSDVITYQIFLLGHFIGLIVSIFIVGLVLVIGDIM